MHRFSPEKAHKLENSERYGLFQPEQTLRQFGLREGMTFVDIGAGTGFFSRAASAIVGETGTVYVVDISSEMLNAFRHYGVPENVHLIESGMFDIPCLSVSADVTLFAFVLHESEDIQKSLTEAMRITKLGGRIAINRMEETSGRKRPADGRTIGDGRSACSNSWTKRDCFWRSESFSLLLHPTNKLNKKF